jgi:predicted phage baseplate assembly protein
VRFGPLIRGPDGAYRQYGDVPPAGSVVRIRGYWEGGGQAGNVGEGSLRVLLDPQLPVQVRVENAYPARDGNDGETEQDAWRRAPLALQARGRAITATDYEYLARAADINIARVHCVPDDSPWTVRVLIVPVLSADQQRRPSLAAVLPRTSVLTAVADYLEPRRLLGVRVLVEPPSYVGVSVTADLAVEPDADPQAVRDEAEELLYRFIHPLTGGREGTGWRLGHQVSSWVIQSLLEQVPRVCTAQSIELYPVDLASAARGAQQQVIELIPTALPVSVDHVVRVTAE